KRSVGFAVQDLKQPRHLLVHARVRTRKNVTLAISIEVHELWSGARASPHARHFGHSPLGLQPLACRKSSRAHVLVRPDLALVELSDEEILRPVPFKVGPTRGGITGAFHAD